MGLVVGAIARFFVPGGSRGGWLASIAVGIVGAIIGVYIGQASGFYRDGEPTGFVMALLGATLIVGVYRVIDSRSRGTY